MANNSNVDVKVTIGVNSKEYHAGLRAANQATKEFKRQQKEMLKTAGIDKGYESIVAAAKKLAPAISAGAAAMAVANKAMKENQTFTDEWARITESATASYESFVNSLSHGDFSNFFDNMKEVISTARDAADAIDNLDTTKIFTSREMADLNLAAAKYRLVLRDKTASAADKEAARVGLLETRDKQLAATRELQNANIETFASTLADYLTRKGLRTSAADLIQKGEDGIYSIKKGSVFEKYFKDLTTYRSMDAYYKRFQDDYSAVKGWQKVGYVTDAETGVTIGKSEYEALRAALELSDEKLKKAFDYYIAGIDAEVAIINQKASDSRYTASIDGGSSSASAKAPAGSIAAKRQEVADAKKAVEMATDDAARFTAQKFYEQLQKELEHLENFKPGAIATGGLDITRTQLTGLRGIDTQAITDETDAMENNAKATEIAAEGIVTLTNTIGQLGILSNVVAPEVQQFTRTLGSILSTVGSAIGGPWGKALQGIGGLVGSFSGGGIVGGTSYKGDHLLAAVNSKELMLNTYQQKNLLDMINGGNGGGQTISYVIRGEDLWLILNNHKRRTHKS